MVTPWLCCTLCSIVVNALATGAGLFARWGFWSNAAFIAFRDSKISGQQVLFRFAKTSKILLPADCSPGPSGPFYSLHLQPSGDFTREPAIVGLRGMNKLL